MTLLFIIVALKGAHETLKKKVLPWRGPVVEKRKKSIAAVAAAFAMVIKIFL